MMLNGKALGLAVGILWALVVFTTTLLAIVSDFGRALMRTYGSVHPGYSISVTGAFIGAIYSFICGYVGAYIIVWLYNQFSKK